MKNFYFRDINMSVYFLNRPGILFPHARLNPISGFYKERKNHKF
jgi:hypothetical protein